MNQHLKSQMYLAQCQIPSPINIRQWQSLERPERRCCTSTYAYSKIALRIIFVPRPIYV